MTVYSGSSATLPNVWKTKSQNHTAFAFGNTIYTFWYINVPDVATFYGMPFDFITFFGHFHTLLLNTKLLQIVCLMYTFWHVNMPNVIASYERFCDSIALNFAHNWWILISKVLYLHYINWVLDEYKHLNIIKIRRDCKLWNASWFYCVHYRDRRSLMYNVLYLHQNFTDCVNTLLLICCHIRCNYLKTLMLVFINLW